MTVQQPPKQCYIVTGYPASGKTFISRLLDDIIDAIFLETGDIVRDGASEYFDCEVSELESHELGNYSTRRREEDGPLYVIEDCIEMVEADIDFPESPVILSGLRDDEAAARVDEYFDQITIVWVEASLETRLTRLQNRGRQDESNYTKEELQERVKRERKWGVDQYQETADIVVDNDTTFANESIADAAIREQLVSELEQRVSA